MFITKYYSARGEIYMTMLGKMSKIFTVFTLLFIFCFSGNAASGDVDTTFKPSTSKSPEGYANNIVVQPDGKILIGGYFSVVNGTGRNSIARLNADGSLDTTFNPPVFGGLSPNIVFSLKLQSDGKIVVGGQFANVNDFYSPDVVRLNSDGSVDQTFRHNLRLSGVVYDVGIFPDGKIIAVGTFGDISNSNLTNIIRLNADGSLDNNFRNGSTDSNLRQLEILSDGRFLLGSRSLKRFNADGTQDLTFNTANFDSGGLALDIKILPDGRLIIGGSFQFVNNFNLKYVARLTADGTIDPNFNVNNPGPNASVNAVDSLSDGRIVIAGNFTSYNNVSRSRAALLAQDGTQDATFNPDFTNYGVASAVARQADGKILVSANTTTPGKRILIRFNLDGSVDNSFNTDIGFNQNVWSVVVQPDGKILAGGMFQKANGVTKNSLARFNPDGTLDTSFTPSVFGVNQLVLGLDIQADGRILAASNSGGAYRLFSDGTRDITFPNAQTSYDIKVATDGKILLSSASNVRRFSSEGAQDSTFSTTVTNGAVYRIKPLPDGKVLVVGSFTMVNGVNRGRIARLNSDGSVDTSFNPPGGANNNVYDIDVLPDGKIVIGGEFTGVNFTNRSYVARLDADGTLDTSFNASTNSPVLAVKVESSGKVLIGGSFTVANGTSHSGYARLNADGSTDQTFRQGLGANGAVRDIVLQQDNRILLGGDFFYVNGFGTVGLARLDNTAAVVRSKFDFDGDGRADIGVFRPGSSVWYQLLGPNYQFSAFNFGTSGDILAPADFDGDGKTDLGIFRPSTGTWWYAASSASNAFRAVQFGQTGDIPLPSDIDGNGKADFVVYRPSNNSWNRLTDGNVYSSIVFGTAGDKPLIGDFDNDGKSDPAIFRPSTGQWWYAASSAGNAFRSTQWGIAEDLPVPADYDGDGQTDLAVYRPSNGVWYILRSGNGTALVTQFGVSGDKPVTGDYDGDGKSDIAVYRPSTGEWFILRTTAGFFGLQFGISEDIPIPNAFIR